MASTRLADRLTCRFTHQLAPQVETSAVAVSTATAATPATATVTAATTTKAETTTTRAATTGPSRANVSLWGPVIERLKRSRPRLRLAIAAAVAALAGGFSSFSTDAWLVPGNNTHAHAQDSGRDRGDRDRGDRDRGDRDRGDRDRGDRDRRRWDPKEFVGRVDENGNGILEPSETGGRSRYFLEGAARDAGLDLSRDIPVAKMIEAMEKRNAAREAANNASGSSGSSGSTGSTPGSSSSSSSGSSSSGSGGFGGSGFGGSGFGGGRTNSGGSASSSSGSSSGSSGGSKGGFPGFGAAPTASKPPGFDVPLAPRTASGTSSNAPQYDRRVTEYVDRMMADYDSNKDGVLDKAEIEKAPWQSDPKESDLNKDGRLDREELNQRIARRFGYTPRSGSSSGSSTSGTGSSGTGSGGGSSSGSGDVARVKAYAEGLLKQNDANKNGVLDKDEWANVRSITRDTDTNNDGIVTLDELTTKLGSFGGGGGSSGGSSSSTASSSGSSGSGSGSGGYRSSSGSGYGSSRGDTKQSGEKRSYRQRTVAERMPKGLPDWFARNDEDADGQITMAEYATLWNDAKATEFAKFDLDGDGVITPRECLRSQELETKRK